MAGRWQCLTSPRTEMCSKSCAHALNGSRATVVGGCAVNIEGGDGEMSKLLIELELEESMDDWLDEIQWKRTHDCVAFENAIEECMALARQEVEAERERCAEIVKRVCAKAVGSESTRVGVYLPEILAEEIERQIRGEG